MLKVCEVALGLAKKRIYTFRLRDRLSVTETKTMINWQCRLFFLLWLEKTRSKMWPKQKSFSYFFFFCSYTHDCVVHILPQTYNHSMRMHCLITVYTISRCNLVCVHFRLIVIRFVMVYVRKGVKNSRQLSMEKPEWKILIIAWGCGLHSWVV